MDTENELYKGLEAFIVYAESAIEHICLCYHNGGDDDFGKLAELTQQVYQFSILLVGKETITIFGDLVSALTTEREVWTTWGPGRPEVAIGEEQLCFLVEQGFWIQDIADMFGCCRRTLECKIN